MGARVRLQDIVTKEFKLLGTVTSLRLADDGAVVSYGFGTDRGYNTTRHQRFLRTRAAEHDPQVIKQNNKNVAKLSELKRLKYQLTLKR